MDPVDVSTITPSKSLVQKFKCLQEPERPVNTRRKPRSERPVNTRRKPPSERPVNTRHKVDERPTFYLDNRNKSKPCRAGGVLPYLLRDGILYLLMIKCNDRYEDFGGKTSPGDKSIKHTIAREAWEESNEIIPIEYTLENTKGYGIYIFQAKYLLYLIKAESNYSVDSFGSKEICDNISRTVEWVPISKIKRNFNLHPRLRANEFFDTLLLLQLDCNTLNVD